MTLHVTNNKIVQKIEFYDSKQIKVNRYRLAVGLRSLNIIVFSDQSQKSCCVLMIMLDVLLEEMKKTGNERMKSSNKWKCVGIPSTVQ